MANLSFCSQRAMIAGEPIQASAPDCTSLHLIRRAKTEWHREKPKESETAKKLIGHLGDSIGHRPLFLYFTGGEQLPDTISSVPQISQDLITFESDELLKKSFTVFAICTDGKKDPCCAKFAFAVYSKLKALDSSLESYSVEISHPGGCRFAPTLLCIPSGNCYGWVSASDAQHLLEAEKTQTVVPNKYRGNVYQSEEMCWAIYFAALDAPQLDLESVQCFADDSGMKVYYREQNQPQERILEIVAQAKSFELHSGCFQPEGRKIKRTVYLQTHSADD